MPKTFKWSAVDWSAVGVQDGGNFVSSAKTVVSSVFFMLYVVLVALIMSVITAEALEAILDKKLAPLNQKIEDVNLSMSLINEKYEHMLKKFSTFDEERKELTNVNQALKMELQATTKKLQDLSAAHNDLEQYVRRECVEIRGNTTSK